MLQIQVQVERPTHSSIGDRWHIVCADIINWYSIQVRQMTPIQYQRNRFSSESLYPINTSGTKQQQSRLETLSKQYYKKNAEGERNKIHVWHALGSKRKHNSSETRHFNCFERRAKQMILRDTIRFFVAMLGLQTRTRFSCWL